MSEAPAHRRWPSGNPRLNSFCRSAPTVRSMAFAILFTGDLLRECAFSSRTSAFDQARRLVRLARLLAISPSRNTAVATLSIVEKRDEKTVWPAAGSEHTVAGQTAESKPSQMSSMPSNTPRSQIAVTGMLAQR